MCRFWCEGRSKALCLARTTSRKMPKFHRFRRVRITSFRLHYIIHQKGVYSQVFKLFLKEKGYSRCFIPSFLRIRFLIWQIVYFRNICGGFSGVAGTYVLLVAKSTKSVGSCEFSPHPSKPPSQGRKNKGILSFLFCEFCFSVIFSYKPPPTKSKHSVCSDG